VIRVGGDEPALNRHESGNRAAENGSETESAIPARTRGQPPALIAKPTLETRQMIGRVGCSRSTGRSVRVCVNSPPPPLSPAAPCA